MKYKKNQEQDFSIFEEHIHKGEYEEAAQLLFDVDERSSTRTFRKSIW